MEPEEVERRLAAILSADAVGYSRLMAQDEADTIRTLTTFRDEIGMLVRHHRGRVVDSPGDNVLAELPSALDAVRCACEIQRVLRPGGLLYISDYWLQGDARNRQRYEQFASEFGTYGVFRLPEGAVFRHHERTWIQNLTSDFQPAAIDEIRVETMNGHQADGFQWFGSLPVNGRTHR